MTFNLSAERKSGRSAARRIGIRLLGAAAVLLLGSCYKPDFTAAIYQCDNGVCPANQICNMDKICVVSPSPGCTLGGITVSVNMYFCPGARNTCQSGFMQCLSGDTGYACSGETSMPDLRQTTTADMSGSTVDMAVPVACVVCCRI